MSVAARRRQQTWFFVWLTPGIAALMAALVLVLVLQPRHETAHAENVPAPDFSLPAAWQGSGALSLRAFRGHPVLLNFFNTTCEPCKQESPVLRRAALAYRKAGVVVLGVATGGDTIATARAFARAERLPYPVAVDGNQAVAWHYEVGGWPTSIFVDAQGNLQAQYVGQMDDQTVRNGLAQAGAFACADCTLLPQPSLVGDALTGGAQSKLGADFVYQPAEAAPAFSLPDQHGARITPRSFPGKVVALTFVSANCTAQCPLVASAMGQVERDLGRDRSRTVLMAMSLSPTTDTPFAVWTFAQKAGWLGTDWHYLIGPWWDMTPIYKRYGIFVQGPVTSGAVVHEAEVLLIDQHGRLRAYYGAPFTPARLETGIKALLAGS